MDKEVKLVKDRECITCNRIFECKGKPENTKCVSYEKRKDMKWL